MFLTTGSKANKSHAETNFLQQTGAGSNNPSTALRMTATNKKFVLRHVLLLIVCFKLLIVCF